MPLRVAAYCRVSTDREDQANSLHSQQEYFRSYIETHEDWRLQEIYVDEGLSGTSTCHREAFNRMVADGEAELLDLIVTKEVSRFARNTVDTLSYTRQLKRRGIGVVFLSDNIDTRDNDGELRLTIMASMAQEESRKTSQRVKWGQKRRMEAGVVFGNNSTYGFHTKNGAVTVKEDEAAVIRLIYHKFLGEGKGTHVIARELYEEGIPPPKTATGKWSCVMVRRLLRNEKYVGDLLQKKFITADYLTHKKVLNDGSEEQVYLRDHHQAIIDRITWDGVQAELQRRNAGKAEHTRYSGRYWCSGKIHCGACGSRFILRKTVRPNGDIYKSWGCHSRVHYGNWKQNGQGDFVGCNMRMLNDKTLTVCVQFVLKQLDLDYDALVAELLEDLKTVRGTEVGPPVAGKLTQQRRALEGKKERVMDAHFSGDITAAEMVQMKGKYDAQIAALDAQLRQRWDADRIRAAQMDGLPAIVGAMRESLHTSEAVFGEVIQRVTVYEDSVTIQLRFLPLKFRLFYATSGTGAQYQTKIEKWQTEPL